MSSVNPKFIVYGLYDPRDNQLRYVGKSCKGMRRARSSAKETPSTHKGNWIRQLMGAGLAPYIRVLATARSAKEVAYKEKRLISKFRKKGSLTNISDGGDGLPFLPGLLNPSKNPEIKIKMKASLIEAYKNPDLLNTHRDMAKKRWLDPEYRKKVILKSKTRWTDEVRKKTSDLLKKRWEDKSIRNRFAKKVVAVGKDGQRTSYDSIHEAGRSLALPIGNIHKTLTGKRNHCGGYRFEYA